MSTEVSAPRIIGFARHSNAGHYGILLAKSNLKNGFPLHQHDFFEIEILVEGELMHTVDGAVEHIAVGDFYVLSPTSLHRLEGEGDAAFYNISVYLPDAPPAIAELVRRFRPPVHGHLKGETLATVRTLYDMLFSDARAKVAYEKERVCALIVYILTLLLEEAPAPYVTGGDGNREEYLLAAMEYVRTHFARPITAAEIACHVGVSAGYLSALFSQKMHFGIKEYLVTTRTRHAMSLLATTEGSVTDIAYACGFGSFSNFERSFHRLTGKTPTEYRRTMRKKMG